MTFVLDVFLSTSLAAQSVLFSLPGSTRSAGMGGAGVALIGDAAAMFDNPAAIAAIHHLALEGSFEPYVAGTTYSTGAVAVRAGRLAWGFGAQVLDYGSEPVVVPDSGLGGRRGTATGATFTASDILATSGVVYRRGLLAAGVTVKYAREQIAGWSADAWGGDVGVALAVFDIFALGVSVQNLGGDFGPAGNGARLPRRTRAGFTMNYVDPQGTYRLLTTIEGQWPADGPAQLASGIETGVVTGGVGLVGRLGYVTRSPTSAASRWSVGGGIELRHLHLDYAYQNLALLGGGTHRMGVRWAP
ncbi:MAG TPA: hypothetical protein VNG35_01030 [Gemmatimonadales bacterium]|nr:hypothetical protein [Gemmatimonadales bacterium]